MSRAPDTPHDDRMLLRPYPEYVNGNGRDWKSLRAWAQAIGYIGIPGAIAIFVVYVGATELPRLVKQQQEIITEFRMFRESVGRQNELLDRLILISQRTCSNAARSEDARQNCFTR